ncbi:MAG TPA: SDR family oxidoreductase [Bryobacteraceae bacterium]|nr:SDR family oxidoreductase [Bryobacteraceae bacterium]
MCLASDDDAGSRRTALITGGANGIGLAIARAFAAAGARAIAADLVSPADASGVEFRRLDVASEAEIAQVVSGLDRLDFLVNCAGVIRRDEEFELATFERVLDINLTGTMRMCSVCRPLLRESRGAIVNMASMLSFFGGPRVPAYTASKGGIAQLTKSLAAAWAAEGIRVNAVAPGWIETPLTEALRADATRSAAILSRTPLARWGTPEDVAGPVLFLCSKQAAFITGAILPVDGGYSIV